MLQAREYAPPTSARWSLAVKEAEKLTNIYSSPPIPVLEIAQQQGVDVVFTTFGPHTDKVAGCCDFAKSKIFVNKTDNLGRQMFTMAHELGHWMLHKDIVAHFPEQYQVLPRFHKAAKTPIEQEADRFAAELLVPKKLLLPVKGASVSALAKIFGVSREMMENRLKNV